MNRYKITKIYPVTVGEVTAQTAVHESYIDAHHYSTDEYGYLHFDADFDRVGIYAPGEWSYVHLMIPKEEVRGGITVKTEMLDGEPVTYAELPLSYDPESLGVWGNTNQ